MDEWINDLVERINIFMVHRPGIVPLLGVVLILFNLLLQIYPGPGTWITDSNLFLHLGLLLSVIGLLVVNVYRH